MRWRQAMQPKKLKVIVALTPFMLPMVQIIFAGDWYYRYLSVNAIIIQSDIFLALGYIEKTISQPFEPLFRPLGWWSSNGIFVGPDGPLLPGSFAVAITYSILIYLVLSLISYLRSRRRA